MNHRHNTSLTLNGLILLVKVLVGKLMVNNFFSPIRNASVITMIWSNRCGNYFTDERGNVRHSCHTKRNAYCRCVCVGVCVCFDIANFKHQEQNYAIR